MSCCRAAAGSAAARLQQPEGRGRAPIARSPAPARCRRPIRAASTSRAFAATDETRTPRVGSIVAAKGGQKAQKEAADKEAAERDAKDREAREKREAAEREAKAKDKEKEKESPPAKPAPNGLPGRPAAAELGNAELDQDHAQGRTWDGTDGDAACNANAARDGGAAACAGHVNSRAAAGGSACGARAGTAGAVAHVAAAA